MGFADSFKKNILASQKNTNNEVLRRAILLGTYAVRFSPTQVDAQYPGTYATGLFANSWYPAVNEFDPTVGTVADESASGSYSRINQLASSNAFLRQDGYISLTNSTPYSARVEYLGWPAEDGYSGFIGPYAPLRNAVTTVRGILKT